jgi:cation diffusion facilitator CzcD-associated flavoprotein CzcO
MSSRSVAVVGAGPGGQAMGEYLQLYAELFQLSPHIRLRTPMRERRRNGSRQWLLRTDAGEERYEQVVIATGRYHKPSIPDVPGLQSFFPARRAGGMGYRRLFSAWITPQAFLLE